MSVWQVTPTNSVGVPESRHADFAVLQATIGRSRAAQVHDVHCAFRSRAVRGVCSVIFCIFDRDGSLRIRAPVPFLGQSSEDLIRGRRRVRVGRSEARKQASLNGGSRGRGLSIQVLADLSLLVSATFLLGSGDWNRDCFHLHVIWAGKKFTLYEDVLNTRHWMMLDRTRLR